MASITLRYYTNEQTDRLQGYPLRIETVDAIDMPAEIFVFQRTVESAMNDCNADEFNRIASPDDLEEYPVSVPDPVSEQPYYRTNTVTLYFRCIKDLRETRDLIDTQVSGLVRTLNILADTPIMEEKTYG